MPQKVEIILASGSPRRRELLEREGVSFTVLSADVDESLEPDLLRQPEEAAKKLAERKAGAIVQQVLGDPEYVGAAAIIGADTVVAANGKIYGKPVDEDDACRILGELSGRPHQVITGVSDGAYTEVKLCKHLKQEGKKIVTENAYYLASLTGEHADEH